METDNERLKLENKHLKVRVKELEEELESLQRQFKSRSPLVSYHVMVLEFQLNPPLKFSGKDEEKHEVKPTTPVKKRSPSSAVVFDTDVEMGVVSSSSHAVIDPLPESSGPQEKVENCVKSQQDEDKKIFSLAIAESLTEEKTDVKRIKKRSPSANASSLVLLKVENEDDVKRVRRESVLNKTVKPVSPKVCILGASFA